MNVDSWLRQAKDSIGSLDAELILMRAIGAEDRTFLVAHGERELSEAELDMASRDWELRKEGAPLAYVLGYKEFYGRDFVVDSAVLVPRPESEELVEIIKELNPKTILDVGTGSGCLAITLKLEMPGAKVTAVDIADGALAVAKQNATRLGAEVKYRQSDLMAEINDSYDVIVANLPYVDKNWQWIDRESLSYEPEVALYAEDGGLAVIYELMRQARDRCRYLVLEADPCQHELIMQRAQDWGYGGSWRRGFGVVLEWGKGPSVGKVEDVD